MNHLGSSEGPAGLTRAPQGPVRCPQRHPHPQHHPTPPISAHMGGYRGGPTEAADKAQPDAHRPTGACNTTRIIAYDKPSRIWAVSREQSLVVRLGIFASWCGSGVR
jgi:hypothetical protein